MTLFKMAQVDPTTNIIVHISVWNDPSEAPYLVELPDLAIVGITLEELSQKIEEEKEQILELQKLEALNATRKDPEGASL